MRRITKGNPPELVKELANEPGFPGRLGLTYVSFQQWGWWTSAHDEVMIEEGYRLLHSCKGNDIWAKYGAADRMCYCCNRLIQPGVTLVIQLEPELEALVREGLHCV